MSDLLNTTSEEGNAEDSAPTSQSTPASEAAVAPVSVVSVAAASGGVEAAEAVGTAPTPAEPAPAEPAKPDARALFLEALRARLATANYGLSAGLGLSFSANGLLLFEADDSQEALRAASAALEGAGDDGRAWRFMGNGLDLDTGRYRAVVRITPLP